MTVKRHPMSVLKGTDEARRLMAEVRAHRKPKGDRRSYEQIVEEAIERVDRDPRWS